MKISLAWIFDHIDASLKNHDVEKLVGEFNRKTAEIDGVHRVLVDFKPFFLGRVKSIADNKMMLEVDELKVEVSLPSHELWLEKFTGDRDVVFMLRRSREGWAWACHRDFGCDKDGPLPAFYVLEKDQAGEWRNGLESEDVILEVDNKSITHRPDMWGHRGFAREVAAILGLKMLAEDDLLEDLDAVFEEKRFEPNSDVPFKISIESPARCKKFTGTFLTSIKNRPSNLFVAMRILRLGSRVIDGIVDMTNYVMADWSQPVHAYDAKLLKGNEIVVREAKSGEKVTLLDGTKLELTKEDLVIADAEAPLCLAGIKGGANSGISSSTTSILFEAATFDAASVRRTAARHGVRTDSSARFEKTLSTEQPVEAVRRFVKLATAYGLAPVVSGQIACVGVSQGEKTIGVTHEFLTTRSGIHLDTSFVSSSLEALGFEVSQVDTEHGMMYEIKVPHFRASKDVSIKEDILEEIIRFYGFAEFPTAIPPVAKQPENIGIIMKERTVRNFLAHGAQMMEVKNYAYYDEDFMSEVGLPTGGSWEIQNPVSEQFCRMVQSLIPGMLKNVKENFVDEDSMAFFEFGRTWDLFDAGGIERKKVSGIFFEKRSAVDFYDCKSKVEGMLRAAGFVNMKWNKGASENFPWCSKHEMATVIADGITLGYGGKISRDMITQLSVLPESDAFIFEFDLELVTGTKHKTRIFKQLSKFQGSSFDLSMIVPLKNTMEQVESVLASAGPLVMEVELIDRFQRKEWLDKTSMAFRVVIGHPERTLVKDEIEEARMRAIKAVEAMGCELRS